MASLLQTLINAAQIATAEGDMQTTGHILAAMQSIGEWQPSIGEWQPEPEMYRGNTTHMTMAELDQPRREPMTLAELYAGDMPADYASDIPAGVRSANGLVRSQATGHRHNPNIQPESEWVYEQIAGQPARWINPDSRRVHMPADNCVEDMRNTDWDGESSVYVSMSTDNHSQLPTWFERQLAANLWTDYTARPEPEPTKSDLGTEDKLRKSFSRAWPEQCAALYGEEKMMFDPIPTDAERKTYFSRDYPVEYAALYGADEGTEPMSVVENPCDVMERQSHIMRDYPAEYAALNC
jgi:hypothetical protein